MPVPIVAIEISAPAPPAAAQVDVLVSACNHAASGARCVRAPSDGAGDTPAAVAIVAWQEDLVARLEIGVRSEGSTRWTTRRLEFRAEDEVSECWRTIGFVIGTIVGESSPEPDGVAPQPRPPSEPVRTPSPKPPRTPPSLVQPNGQTAGYVGLEGVLSPVAVSGPWLGGLRLHGAIGARTWPVLVSSSIGYAWPSASVEGIRAEWFTVTLGVRRQLTGGESEPLAVGASLEALLRRQGFASEIPGRGRDEGQRWLGGAQLAADIAWQFIPHVWIGIGVDAFLLQGKTNVRQLGEENVYSHLAYGGDFCLGVSYRW